ncbi:unnamed protein product [Protopolystoma xenopodis]|uniref:SHSP domain-containing protein n=1 Tax=Protopolystoma xenopodis TaxID=117903 RepID=A0A448XNZ2_9PLAT|nr:unnamed protein product [Protopolystoma xenopodis]
MVHFKVRFNAKDFRPEDINVTTMANRLTVNANRSHQTEGSSSSREFCRTIDLPRSIDHEKFQCMLTEVSPYLLFMSHHIRISFFY